MKDNFFEKKPLIRSRISWMLILQMLFSPVMLVGIVWTLIVLVVDIVALYSETLPWSFHVLFFLLYFILLFCLFFPSFFIFRFFIDSCWSLRCVTVYADHIEVRFLLDKTRNYDIRLAKVDCFCLEMREIKSRDITTVCRYIYLLTGRRLWLYVDEGTFRNYDQMLQILEEYCGIPHSNSMVVLTGEERRIAERGGYVELKDVSDEELL